MNRTDAPKKQPVPFGVNGSREDLLATTPAGDNQASYDAGFPPVTMILKAAGGLPPKGQDMNQILFELSAIGRWLTAGALNSFDSTFATAIAGYPKGSVLLGDDGTTIYISTIDANTNNPNSVSTGWINLAKITAIAALAGGADKIPYFTGTNTAAQTDFTSLARSIVGQTTSAGVHSVIGTRSVLAGIVGTSRNARMNIASASATATFNADELIVETALGGAQYRLANLNLSVNLATTGAGGMDTGTVPANGFVGLYVIYNPTTSTAALLAVNASSAVVTEVYGGANMPSGYTASALVGVLPTSSSQFAQCVLAGRSVSIIDSTILTGNGAPGSLAALTITSIPLNTNIIEMTATASLISVDTTGVFVISPSSALIGSRRVTVGASGTGGTVSTTSYVKCPVFGNTRQIYWQAQLASVSYNLVLMGYEF
ncbi:hypothetical protein KVQ01_11040 [Escherichia coli]|uniref:hypothetical protein n=1 Tax=Escherichia coli TaxID=562 RepID=UPI001F05EDE8|nr:hypothetical protein [Escherichia coli]MCH0685554.1 hypothetical protein [Escherichia coli]MDZ8667055.1 hypothetical protein [Escherichia coli]WRX87637.1 hypothetical protein SM938_22175 [Escherichia coli]